MCSMHSRRRNAHSTALPKIKKQGNKITSKSIFLSAHQAQIASCSHPTCRAFSPSQVVSSLHMGRAQAPPLPISPPRQQAPTRHQARDSEAKPFSSGLRSRSQPLLGGGRAAGGGDLWPGPADLCPGQPGFHAGCAPLAFAPLLLPFPRLPAWNTAPLPKSPLA